MRRQSEGENLFENPGGHEDAPLIRNSGRSASASLRLMANDDYNRPSLQGATRPNLTIGDAGAENTIIHGSDPKERVRTI